MRTRIESLSDNHRMKFTDWMVSDKAAFEFLRKSISEVNSELNLIDHLLEKTSVAEFDAWIILNEASTLVGYSELKHTRKVTYKAERELIYFIQEKHRDKGHATRAIAQISSCLRTTIVAFVNPNNLASCRVLCKNGYLAQSSSESGNKYVYATIA